MSNNKNGENKSGAEALSTMIGAIITICCLVTFIFAIITDNSELGVGAVVTMIFVKIFNWIFKVPE